MLTSVGSRYIMNMKLTQKLSACWRILTGCTIAGTLDLNNNEKRFDIRREGTATITIVPGGVWVDVEGGAVFCNPMEHIGALVFDGKYGVGVFSWCSRKGAIISALEGVIRRVGGIIRGEEEKAIALVSRADGIVSKYLGKREPTEADYRFLKDTHGLDRDLVDDVRL